MADVLTVADLELAKKHDTFHSEVITGRAGGSASGAEIYTATNAVTGQVQTTLPKVLRDVGFKPASFNFVTGGTLGVADADKCIYNPAPAGDDNWYSWGGALPHTVATGTDPTAVGSGYVPRTDVVLRNELSSPGGAGLVGGLPVFVTATKYAGGATTSSTSNDAAITAAINDAMATGSYVYWPDIYEVQGNIPNFHSVRHDGPGGLKRGSDLFSVNPSDASTNRLYISASGSAANDGLTSDNPQTLQSVFACLVNFGPVLNGKWRVVFAAGTYAGGASATAIRSKNRLVFEGPNVGHPNEPTAIISGVLGQSYGIYLQHWMYVEVKDIKFKDFTADGGSSGFVCDYHSNVLLTNVHAENCAWAGVNFNNSVKVYVSGGVYKNNRKGIRAYANCMVSIGYGGSATTNRPQINNNIEYGVEIRDCSSGHVDFADISQNAQAGLHVWNHSRVASDGADFTNNFVGVWCDSFSTWGTATSVTFSGNGQDKVFFWSADSGDKRFYYDGDANRWRWGMPGYSTPKTKFFFAGSDASSGSSYNGNVRMALDSLGTTLFGLSAPTSGAVGLSFSTVGISVAGSLLYNLPDNSLRINLNNTDNYRFKTDSFIPVVDNERTLGSSIARWSTVYAATGTINTSDAREKTAPLPIDDAVLDAWGDVQLIAFQWLSSVAQKGDSARWHFGVIAQQVRDAFIARGLDGTHYGLLCYDEWDDELEPVMAYRTNKETGQEEEYDTGEFKLVKEAGNRWGIRPDQCLFLEAAYQRRRGDRIESRLEALETK